MLIPNHYEVFLWFYRMPFDGNLHPERCVNHRPEIINQSLIADEE